MPHPLQSPFRHLRLAALAVACASLSGANLAHSAFDPGPWPAGKSPEEIGQRVAGRYISRPSHLNPAESGFVRQIRYPEVCTWYGALTFAREIGDEKLRAELVKRFEPLLEHEDENGMWHQLLDDPESWPETSCTGMFTSAFITGVKHGWLEASTYGPAARKAWLALTGYLTPEGDIRDVCQGTNIHNPGNPQHGADGHAYYMARERITGDWHGQAPVLWCATAWLRKGGNPGGEKRRE